MATPLTVEKLEAIRSNSQNPDITQAGLAEQLGVSLSTLTRIIGRIRKGTFDKLLEQAKQREAKHSTNGNHGVAKSAIAQPESEPGRKVLKYYERGLTPTEITKKTGLTVATTYYWLNKFGWKHTPKNQPERIDKLSTDKQEPGWLHNAKHLHDQGMSYREIGDKLGVRMTTVAYHLHAKAQRNALVKLDKKEHLNGDAPSTTGINKHVFIGYAFAKVEEYISVLATRANFPAAVLRTRLAELLGHPSFRETDRD